MDPIGDAIQDTLNTEGEDWHAAGYILIVGCQRVSPDGEMESQAFRYIAPDQPPWVTRGLLDEAHEGARESSDEDDLI